MDHSKYRPDIDGLRAVAVLGVLLYHLDAASFSGGYVGVDVFFVISGFLITRLIRDEAVNTGTFSFANFYLRRARRLLPAFLFTLGVCFAVAFFLFPPPLMEQFGESLLYSVASVVNILFWSQSGYFDSASIYKPLLHIWSLSVEEQFYFVWPLLLVFLFFKTPRRSIPYSLFLFFAVSLGMNMVFSDGEAAWISAYLPSIARRIEEGGATIFYWMPFRVFEFSIGALLVWLVERRPQNVWALEPIALAGFAMTIYPMTAYNEFTLFPSYNALLPCLGAAFLIYSGESRYLGKALGNPLFAWIGKISYSLYLIHWPAIVFYKYYIYDFGVLSPAAQIGIGAFSIFAGWAMYTFIEQPFRKNSETPSLRGGLQPDEAIPTPRTRLLRANALAMTKMINTKTFIAFSATIALTLAALSISAWKSDGWAWRSPNSLTAQQIEDGNNRRAPWHNGCRLTRLDAPLCRPDAPMQVLVVGDSHNYVGYDMLAASYYDNQDINLITSSIINSCGFVFENGEITGVNFGTRTRTRCEDTAEALRNPAVYEKIDTLVISSNTIFQKAIEIPILQFLLSKNPNLGVIVIGPYIDTRPYECADIINRFGSSDDCKDPRFVSYFGGDIKNDPLYAEVMKYDFLYIDAVAMLCKESRLENCPTQINGIPMFYDINHPSLEFTLFMGKRMYETYQSELSNMGFSR